MWTSRKKQGERKRRKRKRRASCQKLASFARWPLCSAPRPRWLQFRLITSPSLPLSPINVSFSSPCASISSSSSRHCPPDSRHLYWAVLSVCALLTCACARRLGQHQQHRGRLVHNHTTTQTHTGEVRWSGLLLLLLMLLMLLTVSSLAADDGADHPRLKAAAAAARARETAPPSPPPKTARWKLNWTEPSWTELSRTKVNRDDWGDSRGDDRHDETGRKEERRSKRKMFASLLLPFLPLPLSSLCSDVNPKSFTSRSVASRVGWELSNDDRLIVRSPKPLPLPSGRKSRKEDEAQDWEEEDEDDKKEEWLTNSLEKNYWLDNQVIGWKRFCF